MIHLVFGAAAAASLKHALRKESHKVIGFPIDFSIGPITNIHEENGINQYFQWARETFKPLWWGNLEEDQIVYQQALQHLSTIEDGDQVTIWTCENASEQIGLRICCYLLKDKEIELRFVNTFQAMHDYMKEKDVQMDILHTGESNIEQLGHFYKYSTFPISNKMRNIYAQDGEKMLKSKRLVRSWDKGEIFDEEETRDDPLIIECVRKVQREDPSLTYIKAIRVVGEVIGHTAYALSDAWIEYRIRSLIHDRQLAYKGNLKSMHMYQIKEE